MERKRMYEENGRSYTGCFYYLSADGKDKTYYCMYRKEGKSITAKHGKKSKGYTLRKCSLFRADLLRGKTKTREEERVEAKKSKMYNIEYLYQRYITGRNGKGQDDSKFRLWVLPYWKQRDLGACTNVDTANYREWLDGQLSRRGKELSPQSVKHNISMFRRIVLYAQKHIEGFVLLITDFSIPDVKNETTEDLSSEEYQRLCHVLLTDTVNRPVCDMLLLILNTGMRRGEVLKLQWQHVAYDKSVITLKDPKGKVDVVIPMNSGARNILKQQAKISMYVFPSKDGKKRCHINKQARRIRDLAGLPKSFRPCHGLRHYFGSQLADNGCNLSLIGSLLGHKSVEVTKRYINVRKEAQQEAVEQMSVGEGI